MYKFKVHLPLADLFLRRYTPIHYPFTRVQSTPASPKSIRGFTLLEVIVAFVIFSAVGITAYSWINSSLHGISRAEAAHLRTQQQLNAINFLESVNPFTQEKGNFDTASLEISWEATLQKMLSGQGDKGRYNVGMFEIEVLVYSVILDEEFEFTIQKCAYTNK